MTPWILIPEYMGINYLIIITLIRIGLCFSFAILLKRRLLYCNFQNPLGFLMYFVIFWRNQ